MEQSDNVFCREALTRGHQVAAIVRDPSRITNKDEKLVIVTGDILDGGNIGKAIAGYDVVISAYGPPHGQEGQ